MAVKFRNFHSVNISLTIFSSFQEPQPIYDCIVPLKLLLMKIHNPEMFMVIDNFMDHKDERLAYPDYWKSVKENICNILMNIEDISFTEEEILRVVGLIDTNSHEINNRNGISVKGFFPLGAILSHRCVINSRQIMAKEHPYQNRCR